MRPGRGRLCLVGSIEVAPPDHILVDVPADPLGRGLRAKPLRPSIGYRRCQRISASASSSTLPSWRIERDYQELKQEVGLGHYEGRGWRGFHHHATMCIAAYGFLISERETIPPSRPRRTTLFQTAAIPSRYRPRGSPLAA